MSALGPFTPADFAEQWSRIQRRRHVAPGERQEGFLPVETILSGAASLVVNHRRFGGSTSHLAPSPVPELASLFRRPPSSILAKMANVDGSRSHGARHDMAIGIAVLGRPNVLAAVYGDVLEAARSRGVDADVLPDFLGLQSQGDIRLAGQDEIEPDRSAIERRVAQFQSNLLTPEQTTRLAEVTLRVGQHRFAAAVMSNYSDSCAFCGLHAPDTLRGKSLLRASHIKPWRECSDSERLDPANGVAACPTHDAAFDGGLLMINGRFRIHVSPLLGDMEPKSAILHAFGRPPLLAALRMPDEAPPEARYLRWHREHIWLAA